MRTGANIHHAPRRDRDEGGSGNEVRIDNQRVRQSAGWEGGSGLGARARLRLTLGMHVLSRLAEDPSLAGRRLPSIRAISIASGHHRNTVTAAYSDLRVLGLVVCRRGSGSYASHPPSRLWHASAGSLVCHEPELADLLERELSSRPSEVPAARDTTGPRELLMHPLDRVPPADAQCYPIAPSGSTLSAIRRLPNRSTVVVSSRSRAACRLMRNAIRSIHGESVAVVCTDSPASSDPPRHVRAGQAPAVVFHDPDWPNACSGYPHQPMRFLWPDFARFRAQEPSPHANRNG